jgi:hypothetical protein
MDCKTTPAVTERPELCHFLDLAEHGRHRGSSRGACSARKLATCLVEDLPGLDSQAVAGLLEFARFVQVKPASARDLLDS